MSHIGKEGLTAETGTFVKSYSKPGKKGGAIWTHVYDLGELLPAQLEIPEEAKFVFNPEKTDNKGEKVREFWHMTVDGIDVHSFVKPPLQLRANLTEEEADEAAAQVANGRVDKFVTGLVQVRSRLIKASWGTESSVYLYVNIEEPTPGMEPKFEVVTGLVALDQASVSYGPGDKSSTIVNVVRKDVADALRFLREEKLAEEERENMEAVQDLAHQAVDND